MKRMIFKLLFGILMPFSMNTYAQELGVTGWATITSGPNLSTYSNDMLVKNQNHIIVSASTFNDTLKVGRYNSLLPFEVDESKAAYGDVVFAIENLETESPAIKYAYRTPLYGTRLIDLGNDNYIVMGNTVDYSHLNLYKYTNNTLVDSIILGVQSGSSIYVDEAYIDEDTIIQSERHQQQSFKVEHAHIDEKTKYLFLALSLYYTALGTDIDPGPGVVNPFTRIIAYYKGLGYTDQEIQNLLSSKKFVVLLAIALDPLYQATLLWHSILFATPTNQVVFANVLLSSMVRGSKGNVFGAGKFVGNLKVFDEEGVKEFESALPVHFILSNSYLGINNWFRTYGSGSEYNSSIKLMRRLVGAGEQIIAMMAMEGSDPILTAGQVLAMSQIIMAINVLDGTPQWHVLQALGNGSFYDLLKVAVLGPYLLMNYAFESNIYLNQDKTELINIYGSFGMVFILFLIKLTSQLAYFLQFLQYLLFTGPGFYDASAVHLTQNSPLKAYFSINYTEKIALPGIQDSIPTHTGKEFFADVLVGVYNFGETENGTPLTDGKDVSLFPIEIYPNPVQSNLFLRWDDSPNNIAYSIINLQGQTVLIGQYTKDHPIDVKNLPSGTYMIRLENNGQVLSRAFIKE